MITYFRYYSNVNDTNWPPEVRYYNEKFTKLIEAIKRRHDPVVTTVVCYYYVIMFIFYIKFLLTWLLLTLG
jgi:hypothetical protein